MGIFNIIPGLSGSALLIILGLYEKCLNKISTLFRYPKENFLFLFPIALGVVIGTYLFSKVIFISLGTYPKETYIVFTGFLLGTIPNLFKEATKKGFKRSYLVPLFITLIIGLLLLFFKVDNNCYNITYDFMSLLKYFFIGIVLSVSTIIPGISSTILLSLFNLYSIYIYSISSINLFVLIPTSMGFILTTIILSKIISYLLDRFYGYTFFAILGFTLGSILTLMDFNLIFSTSIIISIFISIFCFMITIITFNKIK